MSSHLSYHHSDESSLSDEDMSSNGEFSSTQNDTPKAVATAGKSQPLKRQEDRAVYRMKLVMIVALLISALAVSLCLFFYLDNAEIDKFTEANQAAQQKVVEAVTSSLYFTLGAIDSFMVDSMSIAGSSNQTWPTVTDVSTTSRLAYQIECNANLTYSCRSTSLYEQQSC